MTTTSPGEGARDTSDFTDPDWQPYYSIYNPDHGHRVSGTILVAQDIYSRRLENSRDILLYLPPSYETGRGRYPVIYMHDGQNLFDPATSFAGEWGVDETMEYLAYTEGIEAIIVGVPNMGRHRLDEYSPFVEPRLGGGDGDSYLAFLAHTLKPLIDRDFRTLPGREATGLMGSSMGGLISLYGYFALPDVFGLAGVMSPSLWFGHEAIYDYVEAADYVPGRIYLDAGTRELGEDLHNGLPHRATSSRKYYAGVRRMKRILIRKGFRPTIDLLHVEEKWAGHGESSWARRLPDAIRFLLADTPTN
ncbi:MAG: alpha/beta hydrolase-fold protein [Chloroflexota bacterium]